MRPASLPGAARDVCVETVFPASAVEAHIVIHAAAEENDRAASFDPGHGHRETAAGQEAAAQSPSNDPPSASLPEKLGASGTGSASASPASSPETPQTETAAEKNPWSAWAWLGMGKTSSPKIPNILHVHVSPFFPPFYPVLTPP